MKSRFLALSFLALAAIQPALVQSAFAQGAPQTLASVTIDVQKLGDGYRASKIIGARVDNDANDKIGTVNDIIIDRGNNTMYVVLSVGGFLGMGDHLVALPYSMLKIQPDKITLPGGTKQALMNLPEFKYARS